MGKKLIFILLAFFLIIVGSIAYLTFFNPTEVRVEGTTFHLPDGYVEGALNEAGDVNISNHYTSVFIHAYNDNNVNKYVHDYIKERNESNFTADLINFTIDDTVVYKTTIVGQPHTLHYWFIKNDKTYSIYTWDGNDKMDLLIKDMINSVN